MINVGIPLLSPVNKSFFSNRGFVTITNVRTNVAWLHNRLNQAAAQRRRRVCCAQTLLDTEHGATLQLRIEYLPPSHRRLVSVIPQLS